MFKLGDVILVDIYFVDLKESKKRPALVLFEQYSNVVVAGITSNINMRGINVDKKDGLTYESVIKMNYIFTISKDVIIKKLCSLSSRKKIICRELNAMVEC